MYCISSASEKKHEIACTSWLSHLWKLCELVLNIAEQLCIIFMYTGNLYHLHDLAIWKSKWFKNVYIWIRCLDDWSLILSGKPQGLVTIHVNILSMHKHVQGRTPFLLPLTSSRVCFLNSFQYIQNSVWLNSQDLILFKKYHDLPSTSSCEGAAVVFFRNSPE